MEGARDARWMRGGGRNVAADTVIFTPRELMPIIPNGYLFQGVGSGKLMGIIDKNTQNLWGVSAGRRGGDGGMGGGGLLIQTDANIYVVESRAISIFKC